MFNKMVQKSVLVSFMCWNLLLFRFSVLGVATIHEQQRQEIKRLKSELSESLESDNVNVVRSSVIGQPFWTLDKSIKTESIGDEVNAQNRKKVRALRAKIKQAVSEDSYAAIGKETLVSTQSKQHNPITSQDYLKAAEYNKPNIITANLYEDSEIDVRKLQRLQVSKRRNREMLVLKYIEEDFSFGLGAEVNEWKHIVHAGQEYFIGRRIIDLLIVCKETDVYKRVMEIDIGHVITCIESYTYWSLEQEQQEDVILVGTADKVLWYRGNNKTKPFELYSEWVVGSIITGLIHFTLDANNFLAVSLNQSGHYALNIYQYNLESKEFWIAQRLQLNFPCRDVTVLNSGRDFILAVPQNNTAQIYTFNPHEADFSHIHFELKRSIDAKGISSIAGFKMGGSCYLALTGYQPQILLYQQGDFISKTFLAGNFGLVELFFPIPVRTYRDDLVLLVQHRVDFSTHSLPVVETLIWDGDAFETSIPVPCHLGKHVHYGVGCMLDLHRDEGMRGAALIKRGDEAFVIVPRYKTESGLFYFHTELLAKNSELLDLQEILNFLKDWVKEQNNLIAEAEAFLQMPHEELINLKPDLTIIESLKTPEFEFNGKFAEIYVHDHKWTTEDSEMDFDLIIQNVEELERGLTSGRQRRNLDEIHHDGLDFDEVIVEELELEKVNGQYFFIQNAELNFDGLINLYELEVLEKSTNLQKRQLNDEDFTLNGNLEFYEINGIDWSHIKSNLVFKTQSENFTDLEVKGEVLVENLLKINTLNNLNFPDDYMLSNGSTISTVTAEKHFAGTLVVSSVDTNGLVNGKNPMDIITLTDPQEWEGMPTFNQLEISEVFELHGQVHDLDSKKLPQNPTLRESNIIQATCHFNAITIIGPLVLKGELHNKPLSAFLKDVILRPENPLDKILVPSSKSFDVILFAEDLELENSTINKIPVTDFVTLQTNQILNLTSLEGYVYFYNLTLNGYYDGVKIEDVLKEVILLDQPIDLSTTELIFPEKIKANSVIILETVNKHQIKSNLQTLQEDMNIEAAHFETLRTQQADFSNNILGQGKLNNIELHSFINERAWHEPSIKGNIFLDELFLEKGIKTDELHGIDAESLLDFLNQIDELPNMALNGKIQVGHITVTGDVQLHKLNGLLFDEEIQLTTIKLHHPNFLSTNLNFRNRLDIRGRLNVIGDFRGNYLPNLINDIVIRTTNSCIEITAPKSFTQPVDVLQNTEIKSLNSIPINNIAQITKHNNFNGSVHLKGNLVVQTLNVNGYVNNFNWRDLESLLYFDEKLENFVLKNTIEFDTLLFLEDLTVLGNLNDVRDLMDFFGNLIYKNKICLLNGKNTFSGRITIDQGALIRYLNGHDLFNLFNNLIFIHDPQPVVVQAPITFKYSLHANEIQVKKSLIVKCLSGYTLKEWADNTLRVDQDENIPYVLEFVSGSLDGNSLFVSFVNDKDLSRIITLNTPQSFNETVKFSEIFLSGFISCKGWVNNLDLQEEFNNTLMTSGHQHIITPLNIQTITVLGDLNIRGLVNGNKDLKDVATLGEDIIFKSPLYFQSISTRQVFFKYLVTGINFNKWFESAVKNLYSGTQYVTGSWSTKYLTVRTDPKQFQYFMNGLHPWQYYPFVRLARNANNGAPDNYKICPRIIEIFRGIDKKPVYIKHIEEYFGINFGKELKNKNESLHKLFDVKSNQEHFLLINFKCESLIYKWLAEQNKFIFKTSFESGPVDGISIIPILNNSKKLQFITNFETAENIDCDFKGVKRWKVENDSIILESDLPWFSDLLFKTAGKNSSLWALDNETIQELDLDYKIKQKWQLPAEENKTRYRFVPLKKEHEILLTNGENLISISNHVANKSENSFLNTQKVQVQYFNSNNQQLGKSKSLLKPNNTITRSFVFPNFEPAIECILADLKQRVNQQLSIPESDLFDEHLLPDFMTIMNELQRQNIYDSKKINISFSKMILPEYPPQALATRIVQITWPAVLEIEKIHSNLKTNGSHNHSLYNCITKSLCILIYDVLMLANTESNSSDAADLKLNHVIKRIREFEKELDSFLKTCKNDYKIEVNKFAYDDIKENARNQELIFSPQNHKVFMYEKKFFLPGFKQGEILSFEVGSVSNPLHMWAVANTNAALTSNNPGIYIHVESVNGQLYQVISAIQPRSLQQLRIKQETLLMYIQECCQIQILKYRGMQGFEAFAEINRSETIKQILTISVPSNQNNSKYFLLLLLESDIKFYEFVLEGYNSLYTSSASLIPLNCL